YFVNDVVEERTKRAGDVKQEISARAGGQQVFLGPTLTIPYTIPATDSKAKASYGVYVVYPSKVAATVTVRAEERRRSLFKVPVYQADVQFDAAFDLRGVPSSAPMDAQLDWNHAGIVVGASDVRGALSDGTATIDGKVMTLAPAG